VNELTIEVDAAEAGLDSERLKRVDAHFAGYVSDGRLPGWLLTVRRHGRLAHVARCGSRDLEAGLPVTDDTVWRIYSMTKPVTSVAAMMLYEEGRLALTDPVGAFIPAFNDVRVYAGGSDLRPVTIPAVEPVRIWHLLTHTAGLTYGFHRVHPVDAVYRAAGFEWGTPRGADLAQIERALRRGGGVRGIAGAQAGFLQREREIVAAREFRLCRENGLLAQLRGLGASDLCLVLKFGV